jgi:DNA-binding CsgD family transcriptional regulator
MDYSKRKRLSYLETIFTAIELEIILCIKEGKTSREIAIIRNCAPRTIEKHRSNIIKKLGLTTSQNALLIWIVKHPHYFEG